LSTEAAASNFSIRLFARLLILEGTQTHSILASIESATYLLLEMELWLHKINQASGVDNFSYYSIKWRFCFKLSKLISVFPPINFPFPLGGR
jgi:hypothetical protein